MKIGRSQIGVLFAVSAMWLACNSQSLGPGGDAGNGSPDMAYNGPYADFPATPILDTGGKTAVPQNAADLFGPAGSGAPSGGPCLTDPAIGALFPNNWLRLRFSFNAPSPQNLFEIRVHAANQTNDLVVYTTATQYIMDAGTWANLTQHTVDQPITVTIRGAQLSGGVLVGMPAVGSSGDITIAPVSAAGTIVYWTTSGGTILRGFKIGDEMVHDVLTPAQAGLVSGSQAQCVGCHTSTPDGLYVAFSETANAGNGDPATIGMRSVDGQATVPSFLTTASKALLDRIPQELPSFSLAHWVPGDHTVIFPSAVSGAYQDINWIDLETSSMSQGVGYGIIPRTGDTRQVGAPIFSHDGQTIVYESASSVGAGITVSDADLYTVPYNNRMGGQAKPVMGASDSKYNEFYPAFSSDDKLLAFTRLPTGSSSYNNANNEIFIIPSGGGTATRIVANDPPACTGLKSPGIINSWPKWSPQTQLYNGRQFYWMSFSSIRADGTNPQLYVAGVVIENGNITTYPALYLWNQPAGQANHTAAWDVFMLPIG